MCLIKVSENLLKRGGKATLRKTVSVTTVSIKMTVNIQWTLVKVSSKGPPTNVILRGVSYDRSWQIWIFMLIVNHANLATLKSLVTKDSKILFIVD